MIPAPLESTLNLQHHGRDPLPQFGAGVVTLFSQVHCSKCSPVMRVVAAILDDCDGELANLVFGFGHIVETLAYLAGSCADVTGNFRRSRLASRIRVWDAVDIIRMADERAEFR